MSRSVPHVAWYRFRATFGRRWGDYLAVVLLVGLLGGLAMGAVAGARRTQSSFPAFLASTNASDLGGITAVLNPALGADAGYDPDLTDRISRLPHVRGLQSYAGLNILVLGSDGAPADPASAAPGNGRGSIDGLNFDLDRASVVEGRMANPERADEFVTDAPDAELLGLHVGDVVPLGVYTNEQEVRVVGIGTTSVQPHLRIDATLVGIVVLNRALVQDDVDASFQLVTGLFTPALTRPLLGCCVNYTFTAVQLDEAGGATTVQAAVNGILPKALPAFQDLSLTTAQAERAIKPQAVALGVFGAIAALAALVIAAQIIRRQLLALADEHAVLRAIGAGPTLIASDGLLDYYLAVSVVDHRPDSRHWQDIVAMTWDRGNHSVMQKGFPSVPGRIATVDLSPFPYQGPLDPAEVHGRDDLVADLVERITARRVTALLGPRRYGKTSALRRVAADLTEMTTLWVDLYEVTSMADVAVRFDEALGATTGRFAVAARKVAAGVAVSLGLVKVELTGPARNRPDPAMAFQSLLDVIVATARREPTLLVVDEFSSIGRVRGAAGALRTALQHHCSDLGIVFAGSHPSMMRTLFSARPEPFYGQADLVEIGPLAAVAVEGIVGSGFVSTGRDAGHVAGRIMAFTRGHPQRAMQLADACWRHTAPGHAADTETWGTGLADVRRAAGDGMERLYSGFEGGERAVLRAVARGGSIYGAEAGLLDLSAGAATHARQALLNSGDLAETSGRPAVVDPVLADWLRMRFAI